MLYLPKHFEVSNEGDEVKFIENNPFATVTTFFDEEFYQSFVPVLSTTGTFQFHLSKGNPQNKAIQNGGATVLSFLGEHGYVPTSWFEEERLVPTWNYMTVQVSGSAHQLDGSALRRQIDLMGEHFNSLYGDNWKNTLPTELNDKLHDMIVGYEVRPKSVIGKFKLSQNRTVDSKRSYIQHMKACEHHPYTAMISELEKQL